MFVANYDNVSSLKPGKTTSFSHGAISRLVSLFTICIEIWQRNGYGK